MVVSLMPARPAQLILYMMTGCYHGMVYKLSVSSFLTSEAVTVQAAELAAQQSARSASGDDDTSDLKRKMAALTRQALKHTAQLCNLPCHNCQVRQW